MKRCGGTRTCSLLSRQAVQEDEQEQALGWGDVDQRMRLPCRNRERDQVGGRQAGPTPTCLLPPPPEKAARSAFRWPKKGSMDGAGKGTADGTKVKKTKRMKQPEKGGE